VNRSLRQIEPITRRLKALPSPLSVTAIIFGIVPLWSLIFMHRPWEIIAHAAGWKAAVFLFNFWIGPVMLSAFALKRHKYLIPLFIVEICTMILYSMVELGAVSAQMMILQFVLIGAMLFFSFFLLRTDALYPLMQGASRPWRASPRVHVGLPVVLSSLEQPGEAKITLQNCSMTGMEISGRADRFVPFVGEKNQHDQWDFVLTLDRKTWEFSADIAWTHEEDGERRFGLRILDKDKIAAFFKALPLEDTQSPLVEAFIRHWQSKPFRQVALSLWAVLILAAFLVPSAKKRFSLHNPPAEQTTIKAGLGPFYRNH
jgi:hypothetical protein